MNIVVFGSFKKRVLPAGWTKDTAIAVLGSGDFDLAGVQPGENARLTAAAMLGSITIVVDEGTNVAMGGFSLFGSRQVKVTSGDGPTIQVLGIVVFGSVTITSPRQT